MQGDGSTEISGGAVSLRAVDALDGLRDLPDEIVQTCITSPPYWGLRDYGPEGQIGSEESPSVYVERLVEVFEQVDRVLTRDGVLWLNMGDTFASAWACGRPNRVGNGSLPDGSRSQRPNRLVEGLKENDLIGAPWRVAFALQAGGWTLRSEVIWHKTNAAPEGRARRPHRAHEHLFMFVRAATPKSRPVYRYRHVDAFDRTVWTLPVSRGGQGHPAAFPEALVEPCILACSDPGDTVLDPFVGSGTTAVVAERLGRRVIGFDLNPDYILLAAERCRRAGLELAA